MHEPYTRSDLTSLLERGGALDQERLAATVIGLLPEEKPEPEPKAKAPAKRVPAKKK